MSEFDFNISNVARKNILELTPYRCARDDYSDGILLDANENSIGSVTSFNSHLKLNRYPDPLHLDLKEKIAKFRGFSIQKEQIFLGVGSDEAIDLLFRIFCNPVIDNVIVTPPTYGMYKVCAKVNDVSVKSAPLTSSFDLDIEGTLSLIDNNTKLIFICSPGNPSCKVIPNSEVEKVLTKFKTGIVVVDEAYIDFSSSVSACALLSKYPNVVVLQTLSKAFGLAGIRLGMLIGKQDVVQLFNNVKAPYNINKLTAEVANAVFDDPVALQSYTTNVSILMQERDFLLQEMKKIKVIKKIHHTDANFILFVVEKAQQIYKTMADRGVVCRYRGTEIHCENCLRVTVGTRIENEAFLSLFITVCQELQIQ